MAHEISEPFEQLPELSDVTSEVSKVRQFANFVGVVAVSMAGIEAVGMLYFHSANPLAILSGL